MISMEQVHGNNVVRVGKNDDGSIIKNCDSLISNDTGVTLSVRVADCLPISITDKKGRSFGLIHAGWRGLDNGIIANTIHKMTEEFSANPADFKVEIGPHICVNHYEVQSDVSTKFSSYPDVILKQDGREYFDLAKVAKFQLINSGIISENIKIDDRCTFEYSSLPSFRRNKTSERLVVRLNIQGG